MTRDIVFDESASWYTIESAPSKRIEADFDIDLEDDQLRLPQEESLILTG